MITDPATWFCEWTVHKYDPEATTWLAGRLERAPQGVDFAAHGIRPFEAGYVPGNLLTTAGVTRIVSLLIGAGGQALTATSARIGVGSGGGTAAAADTDLSAAAGAANRQFQVMDATFPTQSAGTVNLQATFGGTLANFSWTEFGIDIGTPTVTAGTTVNAVLLNHKTGIGQGTKASGQTWVAQASISIS